MATDWKQKHADDSELAFDHAIVDEAVDEYIDNMKSNYAIDLSKGLPGMGLHKVMSAVAQVARAQALGFDPDLLRLSSTEANEEILALARKAVELGKPVVCRRPECIPRGTTVTKPYAGTEVSAEKTQGQIDELLAEHRISDIRWTTTTALKVLEFHHTIREETEDWCYNCRDFKQGRAGRQYHGAHKKMRIRAVLGVRIVIGWSHDEAERRRLMRVLWWMLKSKFAIVDAGLVVFEEEFMPHLTLGQGRRMWDAFKPELDRRIEDGADLSAGIAELNLPALTAGSGR